MMRNSIFTLLILLMVSMPVLAQSYLPGVSDGSHNQDKNVNHSYKSGEMQNNPAMVNPSDPTGVNSNTPTSSGTPPSSSAPGMNSGGQSPLAPPSGH